MQSAKSILGGRDKEKLVAQDNLISTLVPEWIDNKVHSMDLAVFATETKDSYHSGQWGSICAGICPEYVQTRLSYSHANPARQVSRKVDIFHTGLLAGEK